jgi:LacI family transcriptional regulator
MRTLEQISRDTGVSVSTISRVLHGRDDVSAPTRERVQDALRRARYSLLSKPTRRGRPALRQKLTKKIAVLCKSHAEVRRNPFAAPILMAALEAGAPNLAGGSEMISVDWPDEQAALPDALNEMDAAIAICCTRDLSAVAAKLPLVTVDWYAAGNGCDGVVPDYRRGAFDALSALLASGHRRIALTSSRRGVGPGEGFEAELYDGARRAFEMADAPVWEHLVAGYAVTPEEGYAMGKRLLSLSAEQRPTALFGSDHGMLGALRAAHDLNIRVPEQLALIGVDDIVLGRYSVPRLSTVRVDKEALARTAVDRALWRIANRTAPVCRLLIDCQFIQRDSCGTKKGK